ncbi:PREDICTED: uncharacterized protein LOC105149327 isoform X2 [Acromyrmex echinatior]|nr:PREDICTED: uncharacterized protein LOC105149327 isoform X2 [Acromyrmex echinatior]
MRQKAEQSLEQFVVELTEQKCKLGDLQNSLIKCMIICGVQNVDMREKLLQNDSLMMELPTNSHTTTQDHGEDENSKEGNGRNDMATTVNAIKFKKRLGQKQVEG